MRKLILTLFVPFLLCPIGAEEAQLTRVEGDVFVRFAGTKEWIPAEEGTPVEEKDEVQTGDDGRAEVVTAGGDMMEVSEKSVMAVEAMSDRVSSFFLSLGRMVAKVTKQRERRFQVGTPVATLAVRGTEFGVDVNESGSLEMGVLDGQVAVGEQEDLVDAGQGYEFIKGEKPRRLDRLPPGFRKRYLARIVYLRERHPKVIGRWKSLTPEKRKEQRERIRRRWEEKSDRQKRRLEKKLERHLRPHPPRRR